MCLAVPGKIESITDTGELTRAGKVSFGGTLRDVSLALVPDACPGDYVLVHVGLALSKVDESEAARTLEYLRQMNELSELDSPPDTSGP
ncbi:MAG: HypC/HybG/HupF family hydrogenase formation chaperone [Verrucomicrobiales bacterium]|nr:HypC/HybG/HupF family hydrogenase formation chaperone [Verrucomicrobiales bacterium]